MLTAIYGMDLHESEETSDDAAIFDLPLTDISVEIQDCLTVSTRRHLVMGLDTQLFASALKERFPAHFNSLLDWRVVC